MSNQNDKEIEIQVRVENNKPLIEFLNKKAKFISEEHQVDKYFIPSHRNFVNTKP
jgi:adenylate cyclase class IV